MTAWVLATMAGIAIVGWQHAPPEQQRFVVPPAVKAAFAPEALTLSPADGPPPTGAVSTVIPDATYDAFSGATNGESAPRAAVDPDIDPIAVKIGARTDDDRFELLPNYDARGPRTTDQCVTQFIAVVREAIERGHFTKTMKFSALADFYSFIVREYDWPVLSKKALSIQLQRRVKSRIEDRRPLGEGRVRMFNFSQGRRA